jgi:hypothetical protein
MLYPMLVVIYDPFPREEILAVHAVSNVSWFYPRGVALVVVQS